MLLAFHKFSLIMHIMNALQGACNRYSMYSFDSYTNEYEKFIIGDVKAVISMQKFTYH
jgi:hypothetical protein